MRGSWTGALLVLGLALQGLAAEPRTWVNWSFGEQADQAWTRNANCCRDVRVEDGRLKGVINGSDPFVTSPVFSIPAEAGQRVEFRAKVAAGGRGELFWVPVGASGPRQEWSVPVAWIGDGEWHDYSIQPFWQGEKQIAAIRIDFVDGHVGEAPFELAWVRIVGESGEPYAGQPSWSGAALAAWRTSKGCEAQVNGDALVVRSTKQAACELQSPSLKIKSSENSVVSVELATTDGESAELAWASDASSGLQSRKFKLCADGRFHTYNLDLCGEKGWKGDVLLLNVSPLFNKGSGAVRIRSLRVCDELQGSADVSVVQVRQAEAINRAGRPNPILIQLANTGGSDATNVTLRVKKLPKGVKVGSAPGWEHVPAIPATGVASHTFDLVSEKAVSGTAEFEVIGGGETPQSAKAQIEFLPNLKLPKATYVPEPNPVKSEYEIGALYFPGWPRIEAWSRIWPVAPERKPILGWYNEANPEVVDWQIKWAAENGVSYFLVDWYWHKGNQYLDHWVKAFQQAHYKSYLKWAVMWANHNGGGSHSEADQRAVTKFWIENYFNTPEYYRIDGKPVVMIWSPENMEHDMAASGGCKRLLDLSRQMAREAGFKGIYFIAMKWPEASWDPAVVQNLKNMGFDMTSIYHYMDHGGAAETPQRYAFDHVAESNHKLWEGLHETGILPFLPNLSTGWDDRPWHGDKGIEVYGRTVSHFQRICRDAKKFADATGIKRLTLGPLNEWGEGSYAEPCAQFGFGMYEVVRDTFCQKPADGWPLNFVPRDVGLGPYDLPIQPADTSTDWTFSTGTHAWAAAMGIANFKTGEDGLTFSTDTQDPAMERAMPMLFAKRYSKIVVRMKVSATAHGSCQLFWSSGGTPAEETSLSLPLAQDGLYHDYVFEVGKTTTWRGRIGRLRFDPCCEANMQVGIERIQCVPVEK